MFRLLVSAIGTILREEIGCVAVLVKSVPTKAAVGRLHIHPASVMAYILEEEWAVMMWSCWKKRYLIRKSFRFLAANLPNTLNVRYNNIT